MQNISQQSVAELPYHAGNNFRKLFGSFDDESKLGFVEFQPLDWDDVRINGSRFNGDNILDSSSTAEWLFVQFSFPISCDFVDRALV